MQNERFLKPLLVYRKSIKLLLNRVVGPMVFAWLTYSIYQQVIRQPDLDQSLRYIAAGIYGGQAWKFWTVVVLSVLNWLIEARKWQVLMTPVQKLSLQDAFKGTLAGVAFAVNTPNRIGEYGGRMLYLKPEHRLPSVSLTMIGSISQLVITLVAGITGMVLVKTYFTGVAAQYISEAGINLFLGIVSVCTFITVILYFRLSRVIVFFNWLRLPEKWRRHIDIIKDIPVSFLLRVLLLSAFRYVVFVCQYILLLQALQIEVPIMEGCWLISVLYLILALIPTVTLLELGVRGKISIMLLQGFSANTIGIYAGGMAIWLINLIIPALAGSMLTARLKVFNMKR